MFVYRCPLRGFVPAMSEMSFVIRLPAVRTLLFGIVARNMVSGVVGVGFICIMFVFIRQ